MVSTASPDHNVLEHMLLDDSAKPTKLPLSLLQAITDNFSSEQEIGKGGFAVVYKGMLGNGTVAVKKLSKTFDIHEKKFSQEVQCLLKVRHTNIVRFLGYCADTQGEMTDYEGKFVMADVRNRLLCFEFVHNGSLHDYIADASCGLEWRVRYQMIKGICDGLHYLHENHIVHLDLKPSNILLDDNMMPKICDFGLSRCFDENKSKTITSKLVGSLGYLPPEFYSGIITFKTDIYSLGVIIIEVLTGHKGYFPVEKILESWRNRLETSQKDTALQQVRTCAEIGIMCIDSNPDNRPIMQHIIKMFEERASTESGLSSSAAPQVSTLNEYLAPPPFVAEDTGSAWDTVQSFAPSEERNAPGGVAAVEGELKELRIGQTFEGFTGTSSLSTTNDDDASSTTTDGKLKQKIKSWGRGVKMGAEKILLARKKRENR